MLEYFSIILSFLAIIVGIAGDTWNDKKKGIKKITFTGWIAITVGIVTSGIGLYKNCENQKELHWQEQQRREIKSIAYSQLNTTMDGFLRPFEFLYDQACEGLDDSCGLERFYSDDNYYFIQLTSKEFISWLDSIDLRDTAINIYPKSVWWEVFSNGAKTNQTSLNELWTRFGLYYDSETVSQMSALLNDGFFKLQLQYLEAMLNAFHAPNLPDYLNRVPASFFTKGDNGKAYIDFISKIKTLKTTSHKYLITDKNE